MEFAVTTQSAHPHSHAHAHVDGSANMKRIQRLIMFLEAHFGSVELHMPDEDEEPNQDDMNINRSQEPSLLVFLDNAVARIQLMSMVREVVFNSATLLTVSI